MPEKSTMVLSGIIASFCLLVIFGLLQQFEAKVLNLSSQWLLISIFPLIIALILGGYITKFKGFGVELETALKASVSSSIELKATDAISDIPGDEKKSMNYLNKMTEAEALSIKWLVFESGKKNYYLPSAIERYFQKLPNLIFVEVKSKDGKFLCYIPMDYFQDKSAMNQGNRTDFEKLNEFVKALEKEIVLETYARVAISLTIRSGDSLVDVLKKLRAEQLEMAAVVSDSGRYLGVLFAKDVEKRIADAVLSSRQS